MQRQARNKKSTGGTLRATSCTQISTSLVSTHQEGVQTRLPASLPVLPPRGLPAHSLIMQRLTL